MCRHVHHAQVVAQLRRADRADIAAGTATDNNKIIVGHIGPPSKVQTSAAAIIADVDEAVESKAEQGCEIIFA